ncbi:polysaccharide pyruvyl transferase family protein [Microbacterium sp. No. 7]|uniref:polysaccharide pyruvyl transferase family protein n=1 Tax=Microbacterium sp. No. 7 TaxID=1714373 RepID=UPI00300978C6
MRLIEYDASELTPEEWRDGGEARAFNPTIAEVDGGYVIAYRVVQVDSDHRRIATARLDADLALVPGSVRPLSDEIAFADEGLPERAKTWHADPVYLWLRGRLYLLWNDGGARPSNHQFLLEMTSDGQHPASPARELTTLDRRPIEKNWTLFEADGEVYASYSYRPHRVLRVDLDSSDTRIVATTAHRSNFTTDYERIFGIIRGGAQPVRRGDSFLTLAHTSFKTADGRVYRGVLLEFEATAPFRITRIDEVPFDLPNPRGANFKHEKLNPDVHEVVYPRGMVQRGDDWVVAYGLNDEECAVAIVPGDAITSALGTQVRSIFTTADARARLTSLPTEDVSSGSSPSLPVFWYDAKNKLFDPFPAGRRFKTGNFGDLASRWAAKRVSGVELREPAPGAPRLLAIGSVLQRATDGDVVWGSGVKGGSDPLPVGIDLDVRAVRGPYSLEYLAEAGVSTERVTHTFDPGVLFPTLFASELAQTPDRPGLRIVPHYRDDLVLRRKHYEHLDAFISVDTTPLGMMRAMKGADRVIASSLHGIIFAEAMGIPAYWLAPVGGEDELKYYDYYYGTGRTDVKRFESIDDAMRADPMPLPTFDIEAYLATFPHDAVDRLTSDMIRPGQRFPFTQWGLHHFARNFQLAGFGIRDQQGVWMTEPRAALSGELEGAPGDVFGVTITFAPGDPTLFANSQSLRVQANDGPAQVVRWRPGGRDPVEVTFQVTARSTNPLLQLDFGVTPSPATTNITLVDKLARRDPTGLLRKMIPAAPLGKKPRYGVIKAVRVSSLTRRA